MWFINPAMWALISMRRIGVWFQSACPRITLSDFTEPRSVAAEYNEHRRIFTANGALGNSLHSYAPAQCKTAKDLPV